MLSSTQIYEVKSLFQQLRAGFQTKEICLLGLGLCLAHHPCTVRQSRGGGATPLADKHPLTNVEMKNVVENGEEIAQRRVRHFLASGYVQVEQLRVLMVRSDLAASMIFDLDDTLLEDQLRVEVLLPCNR